MKPERELQLDIRVNAITALACPIRGHSYWGECALVLMMLVWGVVVQRREKTRARPVLRVFMGLGCFLTFVGIVVSTLSVQVDDDSMLFAMRAAAFATGCVYLEVILSPRKEPIPHAIAHEREVV